MDFLLRLGVTAPSIRKVNTFQKQVLKGKSYLKSHERHHEYPNPAIDGQMTEYLISRISKNGEKQFLRFEHLKVFVSPFSSSEVENLRKRPPQGFLRLQDLTAETRNLLKTLIQETLVSEMNLDYWRQEISKMRISRKDLVSWVNNGQDGKVVSIDMGQF